MANTNSVYQVKDLVVKFDEKANAYLAEWSFNSKTSYFSKYEVKWWYYTGTGVGFEGTTESIDSIGTKHTQHYSPPEYATMIRVKVLPVATKYKPDKNSSKEVARWTGTSSYKNYSLAKSKPPMPTVSFEQFGTTGLTAIARVDLGDDAQARAYTDHIEFRLFKGTFMNNTRVGSADVKVDGVSHSATHKFSLKPDGRYYVKARAVNYVKTKAVAYSDWTSFAPTDGIYTPLSQVTGVTGEVLSNRALKLSWDKKEHASGYVIEYNTTKARLIINDGNTAVNVDLNTGHYYLDLDPGKTYWFRIKATRATSEYDSPWSEPYSHTIGTAPNPPTVWTNISTVMVGETVNVYWTHNTTDGSTWHKAKVTFKDVTGKTVTETVTNEDLYADDQTGIYEADLATLGFSPLSGGAITLAVTTRGITDDYSDPSNAREINYLNPPQYNIEINIEPSTEGIPTLTTLPISNTITWDKQFAQSQIPMYDYVEIIANEGYEDTLYDGTLITVEPGDVIFSKNYPMLLPTQEDTDTGSEDEPQETLPSDYPEIEPTPDVETEFTVAFDIGAHEVSFQNGLSYTINHTIHQTNGLTFEQGMSFEVDFARVSFFIAAAPVYDPESMGCNIYPRVYYQNEEDEIDVAYIQEQLVAWFEGQTADFIETGGLVPYENALIDVYRKQPDGEYILISSQENGTSSMVFDPHPSLNTATYRIIATDMSTGQIVYADVDSEPINEYHLIVQWGNNVTIDNEMDEDSTFEIPPISGRIMKLPYNIGITENHDMEVQSVNYIGRKHPVSYYGTQTGETASWTTEVPKYDTETLSMLRDLSVYPGDAYVREPNGNGFWANVKVSYSLNYDALTIPISFEITRVEGGI